MVFQCLLKALSRFMQLSRKGEQKVTGLSLHVSIEIKHLIEILLSPSFLNVSSCSCVFSAFSVLLHLKTGAEGDSQAQSCNKYMRWQKLAKPKSGLKCRQMLHFDGGRAQAVGSCWMLWEAGIGSLPRLWEHQGCICIMAQANIRSGRAPKLEFTKGSFTVGAGLTSQVKKN